MRWILFDLVVGAALLWLVWDARPGGSAVEGAAAPVDAALVLPPEQHQVQHQVTEPEPAAAPAAVPSVRPPAEAAVPSAADRGLRLRMLAREAEALYLRGDR